MLANSFILYYAGYTSMQLAETTNRKTYFEEYDYNGNQIARYEIECFIRNFVVTKDKRFIGETMDGMQPLSVWK